MRRLHMHVTRCAEPSRHHRRCIRLSTRSTKVQWSLLLVRYRVQFSGDGGSSCACSNDVRLGLRASAQRRNGELVMAAKKPNIVIIWGDDIGQTNLSCYSDGLMGYRTPNIDRIANEGMRFTDAYAEQSCTAGRSSFITGQCGFRTGNTKVGMPGAAQGLQHRDVTIAQLLKAQGYATAQFGKNHLGDRNEHLPTVHGFDEFYGALYHLNASEEPEQPDYPNPKDFPKFLSNYGPRGVLDCKATDTDDPTVDPRFGKIGKQTI